MGTPTSGQQRLDEVARYLVAHPDSVATACLCGAQNDARITDVDRNGLAIRLVLCRACGLVRMNPQPAPSSLAWFYQEAYRSIYGPHAAADDEMFKSKLWKGDLVVSALNRAGVAIPKTVMDVGCGGGWTLAPFAARGSTCVGYDLDERLLTLGTKRGFDLRLGDLAKVKADGERASLVICGHVLEHVPDPIDFLRGLRGTLNDDGLLYVEVPITRRIEASLDYESLRYWQRAHLWDFQPAHVSTLLAHAGLEVVWAGDDGESTFALARIAAEPLTPPFPQLGAEVLQQLREYEHKRRRLRQRARMLLRRTATRLRPTVRRAVKSAVTRALGRR